MLQPYTRTQPLVPPPGWVPLALLHPASLHPTISICCSKEKSKDPGQQQRGDLPSVGPSPASSIKLQLCPSLSLQQEGRGHKGPGKWQNQCFCAQRIHLGTCPDPAPSCNTLPRVQAPPCPCPPVAAALPTQGSPCLLPHPSLNMVITGDL